MSVPDDRYLAAVQIGIHAMVEQGQTVHMLVASEDGSGWYRRVRIEPTAEVKGKITEYRMMQYDCEAEGQERTEFFCRGGIS